MTEEKREKTTEKTDDCHFYVAQGFNTSFKKDGFAVVEVDVTPQQRNVLGVPHGAILFALADVAATMAAHSICGGSVVTAGSSENFLFASKTAKHLRAEGRVIKMGRNIAIVQTEVYDQDGNHLLTGQFNMFHAPKGE